MSFNEKPGKPDSKDTARLRAEYQKKADEFRTSRDPATSAKLKDEKQKMFQRVVEQQTAERRESLAEKQKVLSGMGLYKTDAQLRAEAEKAKAETAHRVGGEGRGRR